VVFKKQLLALDNLGMLLGTTPQQGNNCLYIASSLGHEERGPSLSKHPLTVQEIKDLVVVKRL
jgi:hypothetical protein